MDEVAKKARELAEQHHDELEQAADKLGELAKAKFGHDEQIDAAVRKAKDFIPDGQ